jgi:hypothetical protein
MFNPRRYILLAVICGANVAAAQTAPITNGSVGAAKPAQQDQSASPSTPSTGPKTKVPHKPFPFDVKCYWFITETAAEHDRIQKEIQDNPSHFPPDMEARNMSATIGILPEEWQTVLTYVLDARDRLEENERELRVALASSQNSPGFSPKSLPPPELTALGKQHGAIITETMDSLKRELGDESFKKLTASAGPCAQASLH